MLGHLLFRFELVSCGARRLGDAAARDRVDGGGAVSAAVALAVRAPLGAVARGRVAAALAHLAHYARLGAHCSLLTCLSRSALAFVQYSTVQYNTVRKARVRGG